MSRMSSLLSRMLHDNNTRLQRIQQNRAESESRISEGIQMLFSQNIDGESLEASGSENPTTLNHDESSSNSSFSSGEDITQEFSYVTQKFTGHRNARTMIKEANFWGDDFVRKKNGQLIFFKYLKSFVCRSFLVQIVGTFLFGDVRMENS